ncbi:MAG: serpin family protein [Eggerthellaceae bacterium]|jgi:serine protease inhibitor
MYVSKLQNGRDACAELALRLVGAAAAHGPGNVMLSPASAQAVLGMLEEGARGATRKEIREVLGNVKPYPLSFEFSDAAALKESSSLWVNGKTSQMLRRRYIDEVRKRYGADVACMPFNEHMVESLNMRVAHDTDGMIAKMLDKVPQGMLLVLSCLAFSCDWKHPFEAGDVVEGEFHPNPHASQPCTMLCGDSNAYVQLDGAVGITKAYADERFGFFALLPPKGQGPDEFLAGVRGADLRQALDTPCCDKDVSYQLPQLSLECGIRLNDALEALGMREAFTAAADFGGISEAPLSVSEVLQKTRFELDAHGTRASAASMADVVCTGAPDFDRLLLIDFDRPFVLGVESTETHVPLFLGIVRTVSRA